MSKKNKPREDESSGDVKLKVSCRFDPAKRSSSNPLTAIVPLTVTVQYEDDSPVAGNQVEIFCYGDSVTDDRLATNALGKVYVPIYYARESEDDRTLEVNVKVYNKTGDEYRIFSEVWNIPKDQLQNEDEKAAKKEKGPIKLDIESTPRCDDEGKPVPGKIRWVIRCFEGPVESTAAQALISPAGNLKWNNEVKDIAFTVDIPKGGHVAEIEFSQNSVEVDVLLVGHDRKLELALTQEPPPPNRKAPDYWQGNKLARIAFAIIVLGLFLLAFFANWGLWWALGSTGVILSLLAVLTYLLRSSKFGQGITWPLRTNNRWLVITVATSLLSLTLLIATPFGPPLFGTRGSAPASDQTSEKTLTKDEQERERTRNLFKSGEEKTDAELAKEGSKPEVLQSENSSKRRSGSWRVWLARFIIALMLLLITIVYAPITFLDEAQGLLQRIFMRFVLRREEGAAGQSLLERLLPSPRKVTTAEPNNQRVVLGTSPTGQRPSLFSMLTQRSWFPYAFTIASDLLAEFLTERRRR